MDEQPVALATIIRSPKSWVASLTYGVSPQPAQAPLNSNSGWRSWLPLMVSGLEAVQDAVGELFEERLVGVLAGRPGLLDGHHLEGLDLGRADLDAVLAADAILDVDLEAVGEVRGRSWRST